MTRTALIAGGAGAIGAAVARRLAADGVQVVTGDLENGDLPLDVTREEDWTAAVDAVLARYGRIDSLVIASGYYRPNVPVESLGLDEWRRHFSINADGVFLGCRAALGAMKPNGGAIVAIASTLAVQANPNGVAYSASKAAVLATIRAVAKAGGPHGIRANAVLPGPVDTPMLAGNITADTDRDALLALLTARIPLGRIATVDDVAAVIAFLASDAAAFVTGTAIPIDGGQLA